MSRFFVGQRVRVVRPDSGSRVRGLCVGDEGVIESRDPYVDARVRVVGKINPTEMYSEPQETFPMFYEELEPIQPSGHRAGDYSLSELLDRCRAGEGVPA